MDNLSSWLAEEIKTRGWSIRELARRMDTSHTTVADVISGQRQPTWDFCAKIAKVFGEPPERILRLAGLLPAEPEPDQTENQLLAIFRQLSPQEQQFLIASAQGVQGKPGTAPAVIRESAAVYQLPLIPPVPDDEHIMELLKLLDPYHQRTVYDYVRWTLEQQNNPYDSDLNRREKERQYNIGVAELIEAVHALPVDKLPHVLNYLLALKENHLHSE